MILKLRSHLLPYCRLATPVSVFLIILISFGLLLRGNNFFKLRKYGLCDFGHLVVSFGSYFRYSRLS